MKKQTNKKEETFAPSTNELVLTGKVDKVFCQTEKFTSFNLAVTNELPDGKPFTFKIGCRWFGLPYELEDGDMVSINGKLNLNSYETKDGKKSYVICVDCAEIKECNA